MISIIQINDSTMFITTLSIRYKCCDYSTWSLGISQLKSPRIRLSIPIPTGMDIDV
ncbi:MAG: hypothetical protein IID16_06905 [Candidatus Marinimicrobia bacterium]|nr:hypothetical protein [Candidatus Neomarinimicrobiota bacterium]